MRAVFADTLYWVSLTNKLDALHEQAVNLIPALGSPRVVTTELVIVGGVSPSMNTPSKPAKQQLLCGRKMNGISPGRRMLSRSAVTIFVGCYGAERLLPSQRRFWSTHSILRGPPTNVAFRAY